MMMAGNEGCLMDRKGRLSDGYSNVPVPCSDIGVAGWVPTRLIG